MQGYRQLQKIALDLGWQCLRRRGKHHVWISPSGNKLALPSHPLGQAIKAYSAKIRKLT